MLKTLGETKEFNYGLGIFGFMVKAAKINIINANVRTLRQVTTITTPIRLLTRPYRYRRQTGNAKIGITGVLPPQILVWDKANLT